MHGIWNGSNRIIWKNILNFFIKLVYRDFLWVQLAVLVYLSAADIYFRLYYCSNISFLAILIIINSIGHFMSSDIEKGLDQARLLDEAGKNEEAQMCLLELLKEDPNNYAALLMLGGSYFVEGKYTESEMVFERLILMGPGEGKFSIALFNTLWKSGRTEEALEEIRRFMSNTDGVKEKSTIGQYMKITDLIVEDLDQDNRGKDDLNQNH